jgi:ribosomal protein S20
MFDFRRPLLYHSRLIKEKKAWPITNPPFARRGAASAERPSTSRTRLSFAARSRRSEVIKDADKEGAMKLIPETYAVIDRSVKKGTIHPNKAARAKSRLSRQAAKTAPKPAK